MAPPDYANFGTFTDTEFRDIFHRRQHQVVPTGNVIQKLHTHYDTQNSAPILSSVQASSMDATNTQGAWNLLLRSAANPLSQESITTANTAAWTANAIITATPSLTTFRSGIVQVTANLATNVVTSNALTSTKLTVTDTAVVGNLQVLGSVNFGRNITQSFNRQLLGAIGSTADICDIDTYNGTATVQLSIVAAGGLAKLYHFAISNDQDTGGAWQRLLPVSANDYREVVVEIRSTGALSADTRFRLVRVGTATTGSFTCHFTVYYNTDETFNFIPLTTVESDVTPATAIFKATALAQVNGRVGINTDNPSTTLDVVGAAKVSGNVTSGNLSVLGTGNVFALRATTMKVLGASDVQALTATTVGTQSLNVTGGLDVGYMKRREFIVTGISSGGVDFCEVYSEKGSFLMEMTLVQSKTDNQTAKYYKFPITNNATMGAWNNLLPLVDEGLGPNDFIMQIRVTTDVTGTFAKLRLVSSPGTNKDNSDIAVSLTTHGTPFTIGNDIVITQLNTPAVDLDLNVQFYSGTMMTVSKNLVGINGFVSGDPADNPQNDRLSVNGNVSITDTLTIGRVTAGNITTGNLSTGNASVTNLNAIQMVSNVVTSNAMTSKTLTITETAVLGNLQVLGSVNFGRNITQSFNRQLLGAIGSTADICDIDTYNGTATVQLSIVAAGGLAKLYHFAISNDQDTGGQWQRLLPISANDYREVVVEIRSTGALSADTRFRLVRAGTATTGSFTCHFTVYYNTDESFNFIPLTTVETGVTPATTIFKATALAQTNGRVGINTDNPSTTLDVVGAAKVSGNVTSGNLSVLGTGNVFALRATTMKVLGASDVQALTAKTIGADDILTSGNTVTGNATVFTRADPTTFNFSDKMRFYYNAAADALEIQRNIGGTWTKTATLAV